MFVRFITQAACMDQAMAAKLPALMAHESLDTLLASLGGNMSLLRMREVLRFSSML